MVEFYTLISTVEVKIVRAEVVSNQMETDQKGVMSSSSTLTPELQPDFWDF